jgi:photosystem II stability/assembly factor-like uncharacterized protein
MSTPCRPRRLPAVAVAIAVTILLTALQSAQAGLNRWTSIGPSAAYGITRITADPHDPAVLYAQVFNGSLWRSGDGGASWAFASGGLPEPVRAFAVDGVRSGVLYAVISGLAGPISFWTSTDRGETWRIVLSGSPNGVSSQLSLVADPNAAGTLYWVSNGRVSKSTDGGRTWACLPVLFGCTGGPTLFITGFAVDPASSERIYAINNVGLVYRSTDGGATWSDGAVLQPLFGQGVDRLAVSPSDPEIVYAWLNLGGVTGRPCFARSDDRGESWTGVLTGVQCGELFVDPKDGQTLRILVGPERRLWTSHDGGKTWKQGAPAPELGQILPDPADPGALLLAGTEGLFRSEDEGAHWSRWGRRGFNDTPIQVLLGSAEAPGVLYASLGSPALATPVPDPLPRPLQKSTDAGRTWTDLPVSGVSALAIDPRNPRHLYAVSQLDEGRSAFVNRVYESADGGLTWQLAATQPFVAYTRFGTPRVAGLRVHASDGRIVYAATEGGGVYRSTDGGRTWRYSNQGLPIRLRCGTSSCPANAATEIVQEPSTPRILYVLFNGDVYRSTNQGAVWTPASSGLPKFLQALALDPDRSGVLYAGGDVSASSAGVVSAVFKSTDGGRSWKRAATFPSSVLDVAVSRSGVYASTFADGVFRSTDGGRSWNEVSEGLPKASIPLLTPDPLVPGRIYAGTAGMGAYAVRFVP